MRFIPLRSKISRVGSKCHTSMSCFARMLEVLVPSPVFYGVRNVVAGASAFDIKRGLDRAAKRAIESLRSFAVQSRPE
jgi:hypothetical protein